MSVCTIAVVCILWPCQFASNDGTDISSVMIREAVEHGATLPKSILESPNEEILDAFNLALSESSPDSFGAVVQNLASLALRAHDKRRAELASAAISLANQHLTIKDFYILALTFDRSYINDAARAQILERLWAESGDAIRARNPGYFDIEILARFGDAREIRALQKYRAKCFPELKNKGELWHNTDCGRAVMLLAQAGSELDIAYFVELVRDQPNGADKFGILFDRLGGVRDWRAVELIAGYLDDEDFAAESLGYDVYVNTRRYHATVVLYRMLKGFPREASAEEQQAWLDSVKNDPPWAF